MKLQQLRYFQEVCMRNSVTQAANALFVSQPTISNAIRELEEEYGLKLFKRSAGKLTLTKEGGYLLLAAQDLLQQVRQIETKLRDFGGMEKIIRLGITPMLGCITLDMVHDFLKIFPDFKIELHDSPALKARQMLNQEMLDVLVVSGFNTDFENCSNFRLKSREIYFCVNEQNPIAKMKSISIKQAAKQPLVMFTEDYYVRHIIMEHIQETGIVPSNYVELCQLSAHFHMIRKHNFCGFIFADTVKNQPGIVGIPLEKPLKANVEMVWRKNSWQYKGIRKFIEYAKHYQSESEDSQNQRTQLCESSIQC